MKYIIPNWQVPAHIKAVTTTKNIAGYSQDQFAKFNLGMHVTDDLTAVTKNRELLITDLKLAKAPHYLKQTHGIEVVKLPTTEINADAAYTKTKQQVCTILTADCMPILLTNLKGDTVAAIHAGWRGLCNGIIEATLNKFSDEKAQIIAWLGPAISQTAFQVGAEVKAAFIAKDPKASSAFMQDPNSLNKYFCDLYLLARQRLQQQGLESENIYSEDYCTYQQQDKFYSYRRDAGKTGRMATLIWMD